MKLVGNYKKLLIAEAPVIRQYLALPHLHANLLRL